MSKFTFRTVGGLIKHDAERSYYWTPGAVSGFGTVIRRDQPVYVSKDGARAWFALENKNAPSADLRFSVVMYRMGEDGPDYRTTEYADNLEDADALAAESAAHYVG